jgi:hypothetical protein
VTEFCASVPVVFQVVAGVDCNRRGSRAIVSVMPRNALGAPSAVIVPDSALGYPINAHVMRPSAMRTPRYLLLQ